jgi:hypothetical protein
VMSAIQLALFGAHVKGILLVIEPKIDYTCSIKEDASGAVATPRSNDRTTMEVAGMGQYSTRAQRPRSKDSAIPKAIREAVMEESAGCCVYCGWIADTIDHIIPRSYGGSDDRFNLVAACRLCNYIASDKIFDDVDQKRAYLLNELAKSQYKRRRQLNFCAECGALFRQRWEGSTRLLCALCNDTPMTSKVPPVRVVGLRGGRKADALMTRESKRELRALAATGNYTEEALAERYEIKVSSVQKILAGGKKGARQ